MGRILLVWLIANFALPGLAALWLGGWYLGSWAGSLPFRIMLELGLIQVPNLLLPVLLLVYGWPEPVGSLRQALGWVWTGWRALLASLACGAALVVLTLLAVKGLGPGIPYSLPGQEPLEAHGNLWAALGLLLGLLAYVAITVVGEETMFRGLAQTQVGLRYGPWVGLAIAALLFGLRHLPADLFYGAIWQASPRMWLSRQVQLYTAAVLFGLARHYGRSTYASALLHVLTFGLIFSGV